MMRYSILWLLILGFWSSVLSGCSSSGSDPDNPTGSGDSLKTEIAISTYRMRPLRNGESYFLWAKYSNDSAWRRISFLEVKTINTDDSVFMILHPKLPRRIDSLSQISVSIEPTADPAIPTHQLWQGAITVVNNKFVTAPLDPSHLGNFSSLSSSIVFTTFSSDTTAYKKEFYLTSYDGSKFASSLLSLPVPPSGWKYGLWSIDSNFVPLQSSFYGLFISPTGNDSYTYNDTLIDNLPYPGGAALAPMNRASGSIIVTLEPDFYGNEVRKHGPSAFTLLTFDRFLYIQSDVNYPMINVSKYGIPSGKITIRQF